MSVQVKKLKICNFLSFFGCHEVTLEPFSAIMCNFDEGKEDILRAIQFVFGDQLNKISSSQSRNLLHKALWGEFDCGDEPNCFVEVTVQSTPEKISVFCRGIKQSDFEYKINNAAVSVTYYEQSLTNLSLNIQHKNLIIYKQHFNDVIWGNSKELEELLTIILRKNSCVDEWNIISKKIKQLQQIFQNSGKEILQKIKKNNHIIEKFIDSINFLETEKDAQRKNEGRRNFTPFMLPTDADFSKLLAEEQFQSVWDLEEDKQSLLQKFNRLKAEKNKLLAILHVKETKSFFNLSDDDILRNRIAKLKKELNNREARSTLLWEKMKEIASSLYKMSHKISEDMAILVDFEKSYYRQNRFTEYGRFCDYLEPGPFVTLLKKILGEETFYGNFCDNWETAKTCLKYVKKNKFEGRETFNVLSEYSPKLRDFLVASGEMGIKIENVQDLQIFLFKLKRFKLIDFVPVIVGGRFNFQLEKGVNYEDDIFYFNDGISLGKNGLIGYTYGTDKQPEPEESVLARLKYSLVQQELKYCKWRDLHFLRWKTLQAMSSLENDIFYFKVTCKSQKSFHFAEPESKPLPKFYDEYLYFFKHAAERTKDNEKNVTLEAVSKRFSSSDESNISSSLVYDRHFFTSIDAELQDVKNEIIRMKHDIKQISKIIRYLHANFNTILFTINKRTFLLEHPKKIVNEKRLWNLTSPIATDDLEEFMSSKNWRKQTIVSLTENFQTTGNHMKLLKMRLADLTASRKKIITPLLEHCSLYLTYSYNLMMDKSLQFLDLTVSDKQDGLKLLTSRTESTVNVTKICHLPTFLRFTAALVLLLEIAVYDKIPILFLDDIEEFIPIKKEAIQAILGEQTTKRILCKDKITGFQMLMRIGQYLDFFIKKNKPWATVMRNQNKNRSTSGPTQLIYFTSGEMMEATDHLLWIRKKHLPERMMTAELHTYSALEEIHFKHDA